MSGLFAESEPNDLPADAPAALNKHPPDWHFNKFVEFTKFKGEIGEPSPHLAIVGHMSKGHDYHDRLWLLGLYAATYCLPTAQVIWQLYPYRKAVESSQDLRGWLKENWAGVVTRTERRCVRSPQKMGDCLTTFIDWVEHGEPQGLANLSGGETTENYDTVWESVSKIKYFGRYINIRFVEGLRRYFGVPAKLYDIRSVGGWSPKRCLCYLYPEHTSILLTDGREGNELTDKLAYHLLERVKEQLPHVDEYILAAMLCEYKGAFENYHQYPGWTLDQEPLLYDKVMSYWKQPEFNCDMLWEARKAIFPPQVLGELNGWHGTRWDLTKTLRDHGYNWSDLRYDYSKTTNMAQPVERL